MGRGNGVSRAVLSCLVGALSVTSWGCAIDASGTDETDATGVSVALTTVPSGILCLNLKVAGSRSFSQKTTVASGQSSASISIGTFPTGKVSVSAEAYSVACSSITSSSSPTWISDTSDVFVSLGLPVTVGLTLRQVAVSGSVTADFCTATTCAPRVLATAPAYIDRCDIVSSGGRIYYGTDDGRGVWSVPKAGGASSTVYLAPTGATMCPGIASDGTNIYWGVEGSVRQFLKMPVAGGATTVLADVGTSGCGWPQVHGNYLYNQAGNYLYATPKDAPTQVSSFIGTSPEDWGFINGRAYVVDGPTILFAGAEQFYGLQVPVPSDGEGIYAASMALDETNAYVMFQNKLKVVPRNGTTITTIATAGAIAGTSKTEFSRVYVDGTQIYYATNGYTTASPLRATVSELWRCAKPNCTSPVKLASFTTGGITQLAGDEDTIYLGVGKQLMSLTK